MVCGLVGSQRRLKTTITTTKSYTYEDNTTITQVSVVQTKMANFYSTHVISFSTFHNKSPRHSGIDYVSGWSLNSDDFTDRPLNRTAYISKQIYF